MLMESNVYKLFVSIIYLFLIFPLNTSAIQRVWPGIVNDTVIISDTTIIEHDPLILPPGTHILFNKNSTLLSKVPVKAIGTYDNPIIFIGGQGYTSPEWNSFSIECQNTDSVVFKCCIFAYGDNPLMINNIRNVYIQDCYFYKVNNIGITCRKLSKKFVVENCYFLCGHPLPIVKLFEVDSGASAFINKNIINNNDSGCMTSDTINNIYVTDNCCNGLNTNNWLLAFNDQSGIGPHFYSIQYFYPGGFLKSINKLNYSNNKLKVNSYSKTFSIDGKVLTGHTATRLVVLNKIKKSVSCNNVGKNSH